MKEIFLTKNDTPETIRREVIEKLDEIFKDEQLVMLVYPWANQYFPIKSIQHFIETSPTYKAQSEDLIVWFDSVNQCLSIKSMLTGRTFYVQLATKEYLTDFPYIYEGKLSEKNDYIIPIKFK
jgi:hypothetical protein